MAENLFQYSRNKLLHRLIWRGFVSGSIASLVSTAMISYRSNTDAISALSGTNATSHWVWGEKARHKHAYSLRFTAVGYLIHHVCSVFWAVMFERGLIDNEKAEENTGKNTIIPHKASSFSPKHSSVMLQAAAISVGAYIVDYYLIPKRFTPGFEIRLTKKSMFCVYASFAVGLGARHIFMQKIQKPSSGFEKST